ncbi:hypothetical protein MEQU1_001159 [Malassezia equina]|uniref:mRNA-decapping enzyme 1B n=1 Tax=Malassezia equina TaxID=1381935 RepID=A0AAF0EHK9_9BASI|nr:hypothetical protein MEQU1_001159 [Malassezia equina]
MDLDERLQLNTRVLRRFDPCISQILGVASFAVLYSFEKGEWVYETHTSSEAPYFGLQILNRNEPDNFVVGITPEDDIELSSEFIIYRSQHQKKGPYPPPPAPVASESIRLEDLFGTQTDAPAPAPSAPVFTEEDKAGASILNALFRDAAPAQTPSEDLLTAEQPCEETLAPDAEPETDEPAEELQQPEEPVPEKQTIDLDDLFARRASEDEAEPAVAPALAPHEEAPEAPTPNDTETEAQEPVAPEPAIEAPALTPAPATEKASAGLLELLKPSETAARLPPTLLDRAEFVQQLVVLLCTDKAYVDQLYTDYRARHGL